MKRLLPRHPSHLKMLPRDRPMTNLTPNQRGRVCNKRAKTVSNDDLGSVTIDVMEKEQAAKSDTDVEVEDSKLSGAFEQYELCEDVYQNVVETLNKSLY
jgi:hypothetical protein